MVFLGNLSLKIPHFDSSFLRVINILNFNVALRCFEWVAYVHFLNIEVNTQNLETFIVENQIHVQCFSF